MDKETEGSVKGFYAYWIVLLVKITGYQTDISFIQIYTPIADSAATDIEEFYKNMDEAMRQCKLYEINIMQGVEKGQEGDTVGEHRLGQRNERY